MQMRSFRECEKRLSVPSVDALSGVYICLRVFPLANYIDISARVASCPRERVRDACGVGACMCVCVCVRLCAPGVKML